MTWSYSGDPSASPQDEVRFLLGDTNSSNELISDEEIAYLLTKYGSALSAAQQGARAISAKVSSQVDESTGEMSKSKGALAERYRLLAEELKSQIADGDIDMFAGGISIADIESRQEDTDRPSDQFEVGMNDDKRISGDSTRQ